MPIKSKDKEKANRKAQSGWDVGIADAKKRIKELQFTIRVYTEHKKKGEPWPESATHN